MSTKEMNQLIEAEKRISERNNYSDFGVVAVAPAVAPIAIPNGSVSLSTSNLTDAFLNSSITSGKTIMSTMNNVFSSVSNDFTKAQIAWNQISSGVISPTIANVTASKTANDALKVRLDKLYNDSFLPYYTKWKALIKARTDAEAAKKITFNDVVSANVADFTKQVESLKTQILAIYDRIAEIKTGTDNKLADLNKATADAAKAAQQASANQAAQHNDDLLLYAVEPPPGGYDGSGINPQLYNQTPAQQAAEQLAQQQIAQQQAAAKQSSDQLAALQQNQNLPSVAPVPLISINPVLPLLPAVGTVNGQAQDVKTSASTTPDLILGLSKPVFYAIVALAVGVIAILIYKKKQL